MRGRTTAAFTHRADSQAKPATDSLNERWIRDREWKDHNVNGRSGVIEVNTQLSILTDPHALLRGSWVYGLWATRVFIRGAAHHAHHFLPRHAFLDLLESLPRYTRAACNPQPAAEARQHNRCKQQSTEKAATGHGNSSKSKPVADSLGERRVSAQPLGQRPILAEMFFSSGSNFVLAASQFGYLVHQAEASSKQTPGGSNQSQELVNRNRLEQIMVEAGIPCSLFNRSASVARDGDQQRVSERLFAANKLRQTKAVHTRHSDIDNHRIGRGCNCRAERRCTVVGYLHSDLVKAQKKAEAISRIVVVIDNQQTKGFGFHKQTL
jgi:hypothetical protein